MTAIFTNKILDDRFFFTIDLKTPSLVEVSLLKGFNYTSKLLRLIEFPSLLFLSLKAESSDTSKVLLRGGDSFFKFSLFYFLLKGNNRKIRKKFRLKR